MDPTSGDVRYGSYPAPTLEQAQAHAQVEARQAMAYGWEPYAEYWDAARWTLFVAYRRAPLLPAPARGGRRARNTIVAVMAVLVALVITGSMLRLAGGFGMAAVGESASTPEAIQPRSSTPATPLPSEDALSGEVPRFDEGECLSEWIWSDDVECGDLVVLEDRAKPDGRRIRLHVAIMHATGSRPRPQPVLYLEGGPGGSALKDGFIETPFIMDHDLVVIDQRGTGFSSPVLQCAEQMLLLFMRTEADGLRRCRERLTRQGIDLAAYNTTASAADIEDLRRVLGYDQWNLYGVSYGTRLALEVMRRYPDTVHSAILDSVYAMAADLYGDGALNAQRAFDELFGACAVEPLCDAAYPDLEANFYELVEQLDQEPRTAGAFFGLGGLDVDGSVFIGLLFERMYVTWNLPTLPASLATFAHGDWSELDMWVEETLLPAPRSSLLGLTVGFYYSVQCAEALPFVDDSRLGVVEPGVKPAVAHAFDWQHMVDNCAAWDVPPVTPQFNEPVVSDIPTLLLAGTYDPVTPPAWAELAAATLSSAQVVIVPGVGHGVLGSSWCVDGVVTRFLAAPSAPLRTGCVDDMEGLTFELP